MTQAESDKRQKKCALGFDCAGMMQIPGIDPADCDNYVTCRVAKGLHPDEEIELRMRQEREQRHQEWLLRAAIDRQQMEENMIVIRTTRRRIAKQMLMERGCPQTVESLGVLETYNEVMDLLVQLSQHLNSYNDEYVAPPCVEAHSYKVKRPGGMYTYNKLTAKENIFEPEERDDKVKVIHLSHNDDPRNLIARDGIERRNKLLQTKTKLTEIARLIRECLD
ncbi:conserved hypothetical protein (plasmid) [Gloeothece citriformis PCC 7424]|uniref:Uncharacterized protein n=1 Tax=Gloeothece citriformis (strain PCC 7424) TaxID=65393 RepID=B7KLT6_GLOC7|nr:hypothetical protein [Gloeothece citriformis]ACK73758.1 conserved hypothetical protein [Gloeothece citriformis PCC 7424]ACK74024.1 conserved hypothetical protein [Gloeothece citriformis PCC 7424]